MKRQARSKIWIQRACALALGAALGLTSARAHAGSFFADGSYAFDAHAVWRMDFEQQLPPPRPGDDSVVRAQSDSALSGDWVLSLDRYQQGEFLVTLPASPRSYRVSLWARGAEVLGFFAVGYTEAGDRIEEISTLFPTGRVTSDGWVELANEGLRVDGARATVVVAGAVAWGDAEVDALEVVPDGVIDGPVNPPCDGVVDPSACGRDQICIWSECRNVNGWVPPIPAERSDVTQYLENRLQLLFGPFHERTLDLPNAKTAIEQMRHASDPWSYWNGFMLAIRRLHDGHTTTSGTAMFGAIDDNPKPLGGVCFIEGDADLSHGIEPSHPLYHDVLVSHVGSEDTLSLGPGDRLVRVDGMHPIAWARSLITVDWAHHSASNHQTFAEQASRLRETISRFAHEIEVIRCDPGSASCGGLEVISIAALPWKDPAEPAGYVACDNRPLRHLADSPASHGGDYYDVFAGLLLESDPAEKIYGVEWESLFVTGSGNDVGPKLHDAIDLLESDGAQGVIFDHRTGHGGTFSGPPIIWNFAVERRPLTAMEYRQRFEDEQPSLAEGLAVFDEAIDDGWVDYAGSSDPTDMPVALLITEDMSASDWLPLGLKGAPGVRIFGPHQTSGAFSTRLSFGYWFGLTYVIAIGDTFDAQGQTLNGFGVEPDERVLPRQSDLIAGVDTVFEAALGWIRQELGS